MIGTDYIHTSFRKIISYLLLPVMLIFTFQTVFAYTATPSTQHPALNTQHPTSNIQWYISNGKDVVGTTDGSCASKPETYEYTPYGQAVDYSDQQQLRINNEKLRFADNPFQYSGYYQDFESDMYYLNARYYSPKLMRFLNRDTYDLPNRYAYGNGNPISNVDPSGHNAWSWIKKNIIPHGTGWIGVGAAVVLGFVVGAAIRGFLLRRAALRLAEGAWVAVEASDVVAQPVQAASRMVEVGSPLAAAEPDGEAGLKIAAADDYSDAETESGYSEDGFDSAAGPDEVPPVAAHGIEPGGAEAAAAAAPAETAAETGAAAAAAAAPAETAETAEAAEAAAETGAAAAAEPEAAEPAERLQAALKEKFFNSDEPQLEFEGTPFGIDAPPAFPVVAEGVQLALKSPIMFQ